MKRRRGNPRLDDHRNTNTDQANAERQKRADVEAAKLFRILTQLAKMEGITDVGQQAKWLNLHGFKTRLGNAWSARTVKRQRDRMRDRSVEVLSLAGYVTTDKDISGDGV